MKTLLDIVGAILYIIVSLILVVIVAIAYYIYIIVVLLQEFVNYIKSKLK